MYKAVSGNCGKLGVLGSSVEHDYTNVVEDSFELKVGDSVRYSLQLNEHPFFLFLLCANIFCGG